MGLFWWWYEVLYGLGLLLYVPRAIWRKRLPHRGWSMRFGRYPSRIIEALRERHAIWLHAVSVGEVLAAQPLLRALTERFYKEPLVISTVTPSGFEIAEKHAGKNNIPIYLPLDFAGCVNRALDVINPRIFLLMESELWPTLLRLTKARDIPIAVVNGRISSRAFRRYRRARIWLKGLLSHIDLFLMRGQEDVERIIELGAPSRRVRLVGNLKWDASLGSRPTQAQIQEAAKRIGLNSEEIVIVAGSTHRGEEEYVLRAFQAILETEKHARLIIAPRHLERLSELEELSNQIGARTRLLSQPSGSGGWDVGLVDTMGQLSQYYGLANIVFIGGSLIPHGGQNPLEAAGLGKPVIFGPHMHNFAEIASQLVGKEAARQVESGQELIKTVEELLGNRPEAEAMGQRARQLTESCQGVVQRTLEALRPLLE